MPPPFFVFAIFCYGVKIKNGPSIKKSDNYTTIVIIVLEPIVLNRIIERTMSSGHLKIQYWPQNLRLRWN